MNSLTLINFVGSGTEYLIVRSGQNQPPTNTAPEMNAVIIKVSNPGSVVILSRYYEIFSTSNLPKFQIQFYCYT